MFQHLRQAGRSRDCRIGTEIDKETRQGDQLQLGRQPPQYLEERRNSNDNRNCAQVLKISNSLSSPLSQLFCNFHISVSHRVSIESSELTDFSHFGPRNILSLVDYSIHQDLLQENPARHSQSQQFVKSVMPSQVYH